MYGFQNVWNYAHLYIVVKVAKGCEKKEFLFSFFLFSVSSNAQFLRRLVIYSDERLRITTTKKENYVCIMLVISFDNSIYGNYAELCDPPFTTCHYPNAHIFLVIVITDLLCYLK